MLEKAYEAVKNCQNYDDAKKTLEEHGLELTEYDDYDKARTRGYAYFTEDGSQVNPRGIYLIYEWVKKGRDNYVAGRITEITR